MKKENIAILMEITDLGDDYYLFAPVSVETGLLDEDGKFIADDDQVYFNLKDKKVITENHMYCYDNCITDTDLKDIYSNDDYDYYDMIQDYYDIYSKIFYIAKYSFIQDCVTFIDIDMEHLDKTRRDLSSGELIHTFLTNIGDIINCNNYPTFRKNIYNLLDRFDNRFEFVEESESRIQRQKEIEDAFNNAEMSNSEKIVSLYRGVRDVVIGQDDVVKTIISSLDVDDFATSPSHKNRCLVVGKTGTGKTEIFRTIGKLTDRPFVRTDSTQITVAGYVGGTIESNVLIPLMQSAGGRLEYAQHGIVVLDEIDKKGSKSNEDVSGRGVLNSFLPFLDGTTFRFKYNGYMVDFDTSNLSVFASGAFTNVFDYKRKKGYGIGFNSGDSVINKGEIQIEDFIKIGMMPDEFIGRFPILCLMNDLSVSDYEQILTTSSNSQLLFYKKYFKEKYAINLNYTDKFVTEVAKRAIELKLGGRALKRIVEEAIHDARWDVQISNGKYKELILTDETVKDSKKYKLK